MFGMVDHVSVDELDAGGMEHPGVEQFTAIHAAGFETSSIGAGVLLVPSGPVSAEDATFGRPQLLGPGLRLCS